MIGRRADDPNDRIPHEDRRSLRASRVLVAWLAILDASSINTLDSYVEENGRHFVRHYFIDFGAGLGSSTTARQGSPRGTGARRRGGTNAWRRWARWASTGVPTSSSAQTGSETSAAHPAVGWFPAEDFDPDEFRTGPQGAGASPDDRSRRLLGRQAGDVVLGRADRRHRRRRPAIAARRGGVPDARPPRPAGHHRPALPARRDRRRGAASSPTAAARSASTTSRSRAATPTAGEVRYAVSVAGIEGGRPRRRVFGARRVEGPRPLPCRSDRRRLAA